MNKLPREFVERVQNLANDDAFDFLIDLLSNKYQEEWRTSPPEDADKREHLYRMVQACDALREEVRSIASDEKISVFNRGLQNKTKWSII